MNHLEDRFVVSTEDGQHYGNFPTLTLAEKRAKDLVANSDLDVLYVTYNGVTYGIATK